MHELRLLFGEMALSEKVDCNPRRLCLAMKDSEGRPVNTSVQEDAHDFLGRFFDSLEIPAPEFKHTLRLFFTRGAPPPEPLNNQPPASPIHDFTKET